MIQLKFPAGEPIRLQIAPARKFRGLKIPGADLLQAEWQRYAIYIHTFTHPGYCLMLRQFEFKTDEKIVITENVKWLRMETVLAGKLEIKDAMGESLHLLPGQYHITDTAIFQAQFLADISCIYFIAYYSPEMLSTLGLPAEMLLTEPRPLPKNMKDMIDELLINPFDEKLRSFYYGNCIREILFNHAVTPVFAQPGKLTEKQIASMYEVDHFIASHLGDKIRIRELARMIGTNSFTLKKTYEQVFGIGLFQNLVQRRMDYAKHLLETTERPLKDIFAMTGYETVAGFITEFRKRFGLTPNGWRKSKRGQ
jgi:AraC-like DNA-binding protein